MEKTLDMRIRKTYLSLTKALIEMMEVTPFEDIRVKDLCERAMIRKSTFYKHFADKYELLAFVVKDTLQQVDDKFQKNPDESSFELYTRLISELFHFVQENERLVHSAENSNQFILILNILSQQVTPRLREKIEEDQRAGLQLPADPAVMASFFAGAVAETVRQWVLSGKRMSEEELKKQLCGLVEIVYRSADALLNEYR